MGEETYSCDDCGYKTKKEAGFEGERKNWCCFAQRYLSDDAPCQHFLNGVEVGFGKMMHLALLEGRRKLTESEMVMQALVMTAITVPNSDDDGMTVYCTKATSEGLEAMFTLGECYRLGRHVSYNSKIAFFYYKLAADQGYADAQLLLGLCYANGIGIEKDMDQALKYLEDSSWNGQPYAAYWAGVMEQNEGNLHSAKVHFKRAAKQGHAWAQCLLAYMYLDEWIKGKDKAFEKGMFWYICAYLHGNNSRKASDKARDGINYQIEHGNYTKGEVERKSSWIKKLHSQYLVNPKPTWGDYPFSND